MSRKLVKLKDVCTFINGRAYKQDELLDTGKYPVLRVGNFFSKSDWYYSDLELPDDKYCVDGDLLFAWSASFGPKIWDGGKVIYHYHIWKIILSEYLHREYLYYYLKNESERIKSSGHGATMIHVTKGGMEERDFFLPDIQTQKKVSEVLSKVERIIEYKKQKLAELDTLIKSRFVEMFGDPVINNLNWKKAPLVENAKLINGRAYNQDELLDKGKYPVLRVGNFFSNRSWYYSDLELDDDKYCDKGDLLFAWSASFGPKIWQGEKVIFHYHIWKIIVGELYNKEFLSELLELSVESMMGDTHGIGMMHLTKNGMEKTEFILPPINMQNEFVSFSKQVNKLKDQVQMSIDETQLLFDSLMQKYFE